MLHLIQLGATRRTQGTVTVTIIAEKVLCREVPRHIPKESEYRSHTSL